MAEEQNNNVKPNSARTLRKKPGPLGYAGYIMMIFGITLATMKTVQHFKQEPREPLGFDLTLRWGDGGFIAYGVLLAVLGFIMMWRDTGRRRDNSQS
jgi:uncharacterized membrane protein